MKGLLSKDQISKLANYEQEQKRQQKRGRAGGNRRGRNNRD